MLKDKTIKVFDTNDIQEGDIITFCFTQYDDEGEREDGRLLNGLIKDVDELKIKVVFHTGDIIILELEDILEDEVRILKHARFLL